MKKLKLDLEGLQVESFDVSPEQAHGKRGTVQGYSAPFFCQATAACPSWPDTGCEECFGGGGTGGITACEPTSATNCNCTAVGDPCPAPTEFGGTCP